MNLSKTNIFVSIITNLLKLGRVTPDQHFEMMAFNLLVTSDRREIAVNAEESDPYSGQRPEVFISLPVNQMVHEPKDATIFSPGQRVRVTRAPYQSQIGTLMSLKPGLEVLPNGIKAKSAEVELESSIRVKLPLVNLEVLE